MAGLAEIASAAGVSLSTVSRVLNRRPGVGDDTKARVLAALADLPYTPRGLGAPAGSGAIGVLVPELANPIFPAIADALEGAAARAGYASLVVNTRAAAVREDQYVRMLFALGVKGMVFVASESAEAQTSTEHYEKLIAEGVPLVFVNGRTLSLDVPEVRVDVQVAGYTAARHLLELGHRRVGFVSGPEQSLHSRLMHAGWTTALDRVGLAADPALVRAAPFGPAGGAEAIAHLLGIPNPPTAVICASDHMALGVIREAGRRGCRIPEDLSVVGFDDMPLASYCSPALTTMAQPVDGIAEAAIDELVAQLDNGPALDGGHSRVFRPRLVLRESTAPRRPR